MGEDRKIDPTTVARFGLGGLLTGGGLASLLALVHSIKLNRELKWKAQPETSDENTIVLTLPNKAAMQKTANWQTLVAAVLAGGLGTAGGYALLNKLYRQQVMNRMKQEEGSARQEFLDQLIQQPEKGAADRWMPEAMLKQADGGFAYLDVPIAVAMLLGLLGAGGAGYLTKRVLDEKARQRDDVAFDPPKIKQVMFRSQPATPDAMAKAGEAPLTEADVETVKAAICVYIDRMSPTSHILVEPAVAETMKRAGLTTHQLYKQAATDVDNLLLTLDSNPELRRLVLRVAMDQHPVLRHFKWGLRVPGISQLADRELYSGIRTKLAPVNEFPDLGAKTAAVIIPGLSMPMLTASFVGNELANAVGGDKKLDQMATQQGGQQGEQAATQEAAKRQPDPRKVKLLVDKIRVTGADPKAQAYVANNEDRIRGLLKQLMMEGKL